MEVLPFLGIWSNRIDGKFQSVFHTINCHYFCDVVDLLDSGQQFVVRFLRSCINIHLNCDGFVFTRIIYNYNKIASVHIHHLYRIVRTELIGAQRRVLCRFSVYAPPTSQPRVILPEFVPCQGPFSKHLIINLLPVEEVPITPHSGKRGFWRVCGGVVHSAKTVDYEVCFSNKVSISSINLCAFGYSSSTSSNVAYTNSS